MMRKSKSLLIILILCLSMMSWYTVSFAEGQFQDSIILYLGSSEAFIDGQKATIDAENPLVTPLVVEDRTLVPVRFISEALKAKVEWESETKTITVKQETKIIRLVLGSNKIETNGKINTLDVPAQTINDRTYIPMRALSEALGKNVIWDDRGLIILCNENKGFDKNAEKAYVEDALRLFNRNVKADSQMTGLNNTIYRLKNNMPLTIGYFGGSITAGTGASSQENTWRRKTTKWFEANYSNSKITEVNAAIGGFGSLPGVFRCQENLLQFNPDLVFIEYAVNDGSIKEDIIIKCFEGIIRQIYIANPKADIVIVYTTTKDAAEKTYKIGETMTTVKIQQKIADYYKIPTVNVGKALWEVIKSGQNTWEGTLVDGVHPSDDGYAVYAETIVEFLKGELNHEVPQNMSEISLPKAIVEHPMEKARMVDAWTLANDDWVKDTKSMGGRYPHMLTSEKNGATIKVKFIGSIFGVYWLKAPDSGMIEWSIDGGEPQKLSAWDKSSASASRGTYNILSDKLTYGEHMLEIKVLGEHDPNSKGNFVRIGAIFVEQESIN